MIASLHIKNINQLNPISKLIVQASGTRRLCLFLVVAIIKVESGSEW